MCKVKRAKITGYDIGRVKRRERKYKIICHNLAMNCIFIRIIMKSGAWITLAQIVVYTYDIYNASKFTCFQIII